MNKLDFFSNIYKNSVKTLCKYILYIIYHTFNNKQKILSYSLQTQLKSVFFHLAYKLELINVNF